jgi:hypothetical protein
MILIEFSSLTHKENQYMTLTLVSMKYPCFTPMRRKTASQAFPPAARNSFSYGWILHNPFFKRRIMNDVVIVGAVRTPLGSFNGSLSSIPATRLGGLVIDEAVRRAGIDKNSVNE